MDSENLTVEFFREWGDFNPGETRNLPAPAARHMVDCGVAKFVEGQPAGDDAPVVERAVKRVGR